MNHSQPAYGLWLLVVMNSAIFIIFAFSFFKPATARDWRSFGAFSAFIVALFVEMYGFPLTLYLLSGWLQTRYPDLDLLSHDTGHLWSTLLGEKGDPHFGVLHIASYALLAYGFYLLSVSWTVLFAAQGRQELATTGPYARIRHPQYVAFVLILIGFLLQWPTLLTLLMFPVLLLMYGRLAVTEEREMQARSGVAWERYAQRTPRFFPRWERASPVCWLALAAGALVLTASPMSAFAQAGAFSLAAQSSNLQGVTVKVTLKSAGASESRWEFTLVFDTHSGELRDDLLQAASLSTDDGRSLKPLAWTGMPAGGHHREGVLAFDVPPPRPASVELRIQRPGEAAPRTFRWQP